MLDLYVLLLVMALLAGAFAPELVVLDADVVNVDDLGLFGLVAVTAFLVPVAIAYADERRRGGLGWT